MQFPTQFPFLVIPTGAGPGQQRITINFNQDGKIKVYDSGGHLVDSIGGPEGEILIYDTSGNMVISLTSATGTDPISGAPFLAGITTYAIPPSTSFINILNEAVICAATDGSELDLQVSTGAFMFLIPEDIGTPWDGGSVSTAIDFSSGTRPRLDILSPTATGASAFSRMLFTGGGAVNDTSRAEIEADDILLTGECVIGNMAQGTVAITPSAPNTPTSVTVNYGPIFGSTFRGLATAQTTVPGTVVTGVSVNAATSTSAQVFLTRTNTTATTVFWQVWGF